MPVHDYRCPLCFEQEERFVKMKDLSEPQYCEKCQEPMIRLVCAPAVHGDYKEYTCPVTGKPVVGKKQHLENLKRTGCRVLEPGETEGQKRMVKDSNTKFEKELDADVDRVIETMPTTAREQLFKDVEMGAEAQIDRK